MKVQARPPQDVELVLTMTQDELQQLYDASSQRGRRTRAQQRLLERFGQLLVEGAPAGHLQPRTDAGASA